MKSLDVLCDEIREARRARSMTQAELAARLAISQAAVSQFERGNTSAVSADTVRKAADILGIALSATPAAEPVQGIVLKYCEHTDCLANVPYRARGRRILRPRMVDAPAAEVTWCGECGDILMDHCRNEGCGQRVTEGSFCMGCGTAYVPALAEEDLEERRLEADRVLSLTRRRGPRPATG